MWSWLLAVFTLWAGVVGDENQSCPLHHCRCYWDQDNYRAANCKAPAVSAHLTDVFPSIHVLNLKPLHRSQPLKLQPRMFHRFRNIKILNMPNASITQLPDDVFSGLRYVTDIDLSFNRIHYINGIVFKNLPALQTLLLRGNPLVLNSFSTIMSDTLLELDMGQCGLKTVPKDAFTYVNSITHLSLDGNYLQTVGERSLPNNLRYLNLANNKITNVPTEILLSLSFLRRIDLSENPVNCTCGLMLMQDWFSGRGVAFDNDVICHLPEPYHGKKLNKINENELCKYDMYQERQMNKLYSSYKPSRSFRIENEFNTVPTYDVLMADQPRPDDAEVLFSDEITRSMGTHSESRDKATAGDYENVEGSGSDRDFTIDSTDDEGSTAKLDDDDNATENESFETITSADSREAKEISSETTPPNNSTDEENSSKNQSFEIDTSSEVDRSTIDSTSTRPSSTTEDAEGSGDDLPPTIFETSSKVDILDERELFSSTTESSSTASSYGTASSIPSSTSENYSSNIGVGSEQTASEEVATTEGGPETSTEPQHTRFSVTSTSEPTGSSTTTDEPSSEVVETEILRNKAVTDGSEHYSELSTEASISNETVDVVAKADASGPAQSVTTYIIIAVIALPVIILILMAACKRKSPRKVRLPQDTESNIGTELQDMDTLLPKNGTENGVKVVPKANGAANPADSKSPEEVTPVLQTESEAEAAVEPLSEEPRPARQNGATAPIQKTKAKLTVLPDSIPKTPVFIHKTYPE